MCVWLAGLLDVALTDCDAVRWRPNLCCLQDASERLGVVDVQVRLTSLQEVFVAVATEAAV
jgi:hypothetical protein